MPRQRASLMLHVSYQASSVPMSSRTSDAGWEHVVPPRVLAYSVGMEVRSPEIGTPSQRSPMNREKHIVEMQTTSLHRVQDAGDSLPVDNSVSQSQLRQQSLEGRRVCVFATPRSFADSE